jgi:hypothetical protein
VTLQAALNPGESGTVVGRRQKRWSIVASLSGAIRQATPKRTQTTITIRCHINNLRTEAEMDASSTESSNDQNHEQNAQGDEYCAHYSVLYTHQETPL